MPSVPYTFSPHTLIESSKLNANFAVLAQVLGLVGGTLTGTLNTRNILPSADDTYTVGSEANAYASVTVSQFVKIKDFADTYFLSLFNSSDLTANRSFTIDTNDTNSGLDIKNTITLRNTQTVPFSAGRYTAVGGGSWTVGSGDVLDETWSQCGYTVFYNLCVSNTDIAGTVSSLRVALPNSFTLGTTAVVPGFLSDAGTYSSVRVHMTAGLTYLEILKIDGSNFSAGSGNQIISIQVRFEHQ